MESEQQWDKENAWPPMVHMVIEGFRTTGDPLLMKVCVIILGMYHLFRMFYKNVFAFVSLLPPVCDVFHASLDFHELGNFCRQLKLWQHNG